MSSSPTLFDVDAPRTVMTYNIKNGQDFIHWMKRGLALVDVIRQANPCLLGTQEGFDYQLEFIREQIPHLGMVGVGRLEDGSDEYMAIFYDTRIVTIQESGSFWLSDAPDQPGSLMPDEDLPRMATWVRCEIEGHPRPVLMVNTHLTHTGISTAAQVRVLTEQIDARSAGNIDTILTGDFNQHRMSPAWQSVVDAGFTDALDFADDHAGPLFTFPDWNVVNEHDEASRPITDRIDWIMYRPAPDGALPTGVTVRTLNSHANGEIPSDHFPVLLTNR